DLLFTQPQTIADLRGMLVGSTYPLYAPNRRWSYPYRAGADVFFNHERVHATYNATTSLLQELFNRQRGLKQGLQPTALPLEFSRPFQLPPGPPRPPIWIGVVGNRGTYPLRVFDAPDPVEEGQHDPWPNPPRISDAARECELTLMSSVKESEIPATGNGTIIVAATWDNLLHFRMFE